MLFSRKKTAPTTDTVKITTETQIKETPSKSDTVIEVIKATVPPKTVDINIAAFEKGYELA